MVAGGGASAGVGIGVVDGVFSEGFSGFIMFLSFFCGFYFRLSDRKSVAQAGRFGNLGKRCFCWLLLALRVFRGLPHLLPAAVHVGFVQLTSVLELSCELEKASRPNPEFLPGEL